MEEQKIVSKEVKMNVAKTGNREKQQKLSYDELNQACMEMSQQLQNQNKYIQQLRQQMQQMDFALQTKRMDYLFKVVEISNNYRSSDYPCFARDFVENCLAEIQEALTIPAQEKEEVNKES